MADNNGQGKKSLLVSVMKGLGYLSDPKTKPGKVFTWAEKKATDLATKLAQNDKYLDFAGRTMSRGFLMQARVTRAQEEVLRAMRLPTTGEVNQVRDQLRRLGDQVEALSSQLEMVLETLEDMKKSAKTKTGAASVEHNLQ